ncbi:hypothetical protein N658DRAFT_567757 [Parathielavia hyrcaniae]|uniref:Uncharacterized protein n=1 Tax=Parathielavia hyrcaniae TaxID=113614 RepID=A0AAN6Q317_9PEZI|nr:hypothetical protein N658DRAFT_567757 [Parathielavia hyrcaniae]
MEVTARSRLDMKVKAEDDSADARMADDRPTYRSWKKKYRKMRIVFDQKMHDGEDLHKLEQKALATAQRLAIQNDQLLDLLLDVNSTAQIPPEKRIDLSLDLPTDDDALLLDIDRPSTPPPGPTAAKAYKDLLQEVPHLPFSSAPERFPELVTDLEAGRDSPADPAQGQSHPPTFLTADDIDNYIWELDAHIDDEQLGFGARKSDLPPPLPTLAPLAHADRPNPKDAQRDLAARNPTSVYNWLRKHAPKTFLQDAEHHDNSKENGGGGDHHDGHHGSGRGRGGTKGERAPRGGAGTGPARGKRAIAAHSRATAAATAATAESYGEDPDDELGYGGDGGSAVTTPAGALGDDDPGYRPKGGSSRPTKKKRKSEGGGGTDKPPTAPYMGPRKSGPMTPDMRKMWEAKRAREEAKKETKKEKKEAKKPL